MAVTQKEALQAPSASAGTSPRSRLGLVRMVISCSVGVPVEESVPHRHPQYAQIEPGSPVGDVIKVVLDALPQGGVAAPAVNLGPTGYAGLDAVTGHVVGNGVAELLD